MFLVEDHRQGMTYLVFTWGDPRQAGFKGTAVEGVTLDWDMDYTSSWPDGADCPEVCVGRNPNNSKHYKVFKYPRELRQAGFEPVAGEPVFFGSWSDYLKLWAPDQLSDEEWYSHLDNLDEASRRRRQRVEVSANPPSSGRDDVAAWVANKHRVVDSSIREVWYLPKDAPANEIRLLEVNDRLEGSETRPEPIDFGLDVEGTHFRLFVADVTTDQLERIKHDATLLPPGWSLEGRKTWRRGA